MAKIDLRFIDCDCDDDYIQVKKDYSCSFGDIIKISGFDEQSFEIWLDKSTAIRFAKTLRTEINKIQESEVGNA